jgi:hypothetical protein
MAETPAVNTDSSGGAKRAGPALATGPKRHPRPFSYIFLKMIFPFFSILKQNLI